MEKDNRNAVPVVRKGHTHNVGKVNILELISGFKNTMTAYYKLNYPGMIQDDNSILRHYHITVIIPLFSRSYHTKINQNGPQRTEHICM
jgi:hypothetical protein